MRENLRKAARMLGRKYYHRRDGESTPQYLRRVLIGMHVVFVVVGIPSIAVIGHLKPKTFQDILDLGIGAYLGLMIGAPTGLLLREKIRPKKRD